MEKKPKLWEPLFPRDSRSHAEQRFWPWGESLLYWNAWHKGCRVWTPPAMGGSISRPNKKAYANAKRNWIQSQCQTVSGGPLTAPGTNQGQRHLMWLSRQRRSIMLKSSVCSKKQIIANLDKMVSMLRAPAASPPSAILTLSPWHPLCGRGAWGRGASRATAGAKGGTIAQRCPQPRSPK